MEIMTASKNTSDLPNWVLESDYQFLRKKIFFVVNSCADTLNVGDLFCGCGGLTLGAREACLSLNKNFSSVLAIDNDPSALDVFKKNINCLNPVENDIRSLLDGELGSRPTDSEKLLLSKIPKIDILLAGPPCQGFSSLNNHTRGKDDRNILYQRVARFIELTMPTHILIENVSVATRGLEGSVKKTLDILNELGYKVDNNVVNLVDIGVPQRRKRHVVIASSKKIKVSEVVEKNRVSKKRSVMWAIHDLQDEKYSTTFNTPSKLSPENIRRIRYLHETGEYDLPNYLRPKCHQKPHSYRSMYGRLKPDEPAQTLTGGFFSPGQGRFIHPILQRTLTAHEAARLQFFPDFFDFSKAPTRKSLSQMIGNAAPMILSYIFSMEFLR
jgi:DNA (cytosine-5)-methyltransferase 1